MAIYPVGTIFSDSLFQDSIQSAQGRYDSAVSYADEDWQKTQYEYGYGDIGKANPFSQVALLGRQQGIQRTDQVNQAASRPGSLRSGAYKIRQGNLAFGQGQQQDSLRGQYDNASTANTRRREGIDSQFATDRYQAGADSIARALASKPLGDASGEDGAAAPTGPGPALTRGIGVIKTSPPKTGSTMKLNKKGQWVRVPNQPKKKGVGALYN